MKIIDIGIVIDNVDPKMLGRIRVVRYSDYVAEKENAYDYEKWSEIDPFIASPFLPTNINFIPQIGQSVKVINYDTDKQTINQEYISGPFTTSFNYNNQRFSNQLENTTYGANYKTTQKILNPSGEFINKLTKPIFPKFNHYSISGKFGSDVIFTDNGITLRSGKIENINLKTKKDITLPLISNNISILNLKKFENTYYLSTEENINTNVENKLINFIIEYEIENYQYPYTLNFYVYKVLNDDENLNTNNFNINTTLDNVKLIKNNDLDNYSFKIYDVKNPVIKIRDILFDIYKNGFNQYLNINDNIFPIYFRPTKTFLNYTPLNDNETNLKNKILNDVNLLKVGPNNGLIWSLTSTTPPISNNLKIERKIKVIENKPQTFSSILSDKIYLLSYKSNINTINFNDLDKYELNQENYVRDIDINTYSMVRGEKLVTLLKAIINVLFNHRHNLTKPMVKLGFNDYDSLMELIKNMEIDLLNDSIKIN